MVHVPQEIGLAEIRRGVLDDEARRAYAVAWSAKCDTTGGLGSMEAALKDALLFDVVVAGKTVARYALKTAERPGGIEVFVVAAVGGQPGADLVASITPFIEHQAAGADRLTVNTRRRGLVKKLLAQGWTLDSYVLRKRLK